MAEAFPLKLIEVGVLLVAGVVFFWWQFRDIKRAQVHSAQQRREREAKAAAARAAGEPPASTAAREGPP